MSLVLFGLMWCLTAAVEPKHHPDSTEAVETQIIEILSTVGVTMCNEKCTTRTSCTSFGHDSINLVCYLLQRKQDKTEEYGKCVFIPKRNTKVKAGSCSLKTCQGVRCLETHTGKTVCVEAEGNKQQFLTQPHTKLLSSTIDCDLCGVKHILLEAKAVINTRGLNRRTLVMFAAGKAHKDMFDFLVREGADLSLLDKDRKTVLHIACEEGNIGIVNYILTKDIVDIDSRDNLWQSTTMKAALTGNKDVFELLVRKGTDLSFVDSKLNTILHLACSGGSIEIVNHVFTEKHVYVNSRNEADCTTILNAARKGHKDIFDLLVNKGADIALRGFADNTVLHAACEGGNIEIVQYILRQNVTPINARGWGGLTPLLVAANNGHEEVFDLLVGEGADLLIVTEAGDNILHEACRGGNMKLVTYVLNQNIVDINSRGNSGMKQ